MSIPRPSQTERSPLSLSLPLTATPHSQQVPQLLCRPAQARELKSVPYPGGAALAPREEGDAHFLFLPFDVHGPGPPTDDRPLAKDYHEEA